MYSVRPGLNKVFAGVPVTISHMPNGNVAVCTERREMIYMEIFLGDHIPEGFSYVSAVDADPEQEWLLSYKKC